MLCPKLKEKSHTKTNPKPKGSELGNTDDRRDSYSRKENKGQTQVGLEANNQKSITSVAHLAYQVKRLTQKSIVPISVSRWSLTCCSKNREGYCDKGGFPEEQKNEDTTVESRPELMVVKRQRKKLQFIESVRSKRQES